MKNTVSTKEAARRLGVAQATISRLIKKGDLKGYKINPNGKNSPFRVYTESIDALIKARG